MTLGTEKTQLANDGQYARQVRKRKRIIPVTHKQGSVSKLPLVLQQVNEDNSQHRCSSVFSCRTEQTESWRIRTRSRINTGTALIMTLRCQQRSTLLSSPANASQLQPLHLLALQSQKNWFCHPTQK